MDCKCLTPKRRLYIEMACDFADEFPDGAFMAYMEERGIDVSELEVLSDDHNCERSKKWVTTQPTTNSKL